ncbi:hypothetical protein L1887_23623 [Cichorium endivia]|nr:hypothetical protein L1887_23623 [Cichorium endivia]
MAPVTYVDSSAVRALKELYQEYASRDIQIAIANPNKEVLLTLAKSGLIEQVGKEWCFVRVHDAVQVCLQHVPNSNNALPKIPEISPDKHSKFLERLGTRRKEDLSTSEMESGERDKDPDPQLEPLLSRKSH